MAVFQQSGVLNISTNDRECSPFTAEGPPKAVLQIPIHLTTLHLSHCQVFSRVLAGVVQLLRLQSSYFMVGHGRVFMSCVRGTGALTGRS